jgi:hypothetical protein
MRRPCFTSSDGNVTLGNQEEPFRAAQDADGRIRGVRCVCPQSRKGYFRCPWSPCNHVQLSTMSTGQCGRADAR